MNILEARRRTLGKGVYEKTVEGNPAIAQGSLARMYPGITMQGWTEQNGTPTPEAPVPIVSAGTQNQDAGKYQYEVKLTGANLFDGTQFGQNGKVIHIETTFGKQDIIGINYKPNTAYTISVENNEIVIPNGHWSVNFTVYYTDDTFVQVYTYIMVGGKPLITNKNKTIERIVLANPWRVEEIISGIMINEGSTALPYEPYHTPQTVTLTSDRPLTKWDRLEKRDGVWGWVYKSAEIVLDGSEDEDWKLQIDANRKIQFYITLSDALYLYSEPFTEMFYCDTFLTTKNLGTIPNWQVRKGFYNGLAPVFKPSDDIVTADLFRNFLAENPTTILYVTKEETFIPLLESEQEQMNDLYTFRPTTVLSNDARCDVTLTYKTKKSLEVTT